MKLLPNCREPKSVDMPQRGGVRTKWPATWRTRFTRNSGRAARSGFGKHLAPNSLPGGLYRVANGFLNRPTVLPLINGQPNLRSCTYIKDLH